MCSLWLGSGDVFGVRSNHVNMSLTSQTYTAWQCNEVGGKVCIATTRFALPRQGVHCHDKSSLHALSLDPQEISQGMVDDAAIYSSERPSRGLTGQARIASRVGTFSIQGPCPGKVGRLESFVVLGHSAMKAQPEVGSPSI